MRRVRNVPQTDGAASFDDLTSRVPDLLVAPAKKIVTRFANGRAR